MAYSTTADLVFSCGGTDRYNQLADYDNAGVADAVVLARAIADADAMVNSYLDRVYVVPLAIVPDVIRSVASDIAVFILKQRREALTEEDIQSQTLRLEWLEKIAAEKVELGDSIKRATAPSHRTGYTDRPSDKLASREEFKGFS